MKPYSKELRGEVLAACNRGRSAREFATYFMGSGTVARFCEVDPGFRAP